MASLACLSHPPPLPWTDSMSFKVKVFQGCEEELEECLVPKATLPCVP